MPKTVVAPSLLRLLPQHRLKEKRTLQLTLDELIDDYRKIHELTPSELDFLLMAYRYEHIFLDSLNAFTPKKLKPEELEDLWRLAFASLLTRREENIAQLTHAWVEASKSFFGPHTSALSNAFFRRVLRDKEQLLKELNPRKILGPSLTQRWSSHEALQKRFADKIIKRPEAGISCINKEGQWQVIEPKNFHAGTHLAISRASALWVDEIAKRMKEMPSPRVLDACAAPGGKLIALLNKAPQITQAVAVEAKFKRMQRLEENIALWGFSEKANTLLHDWSDQHPSLEGNFEIILADLPCTGLGTLASRPDLLIKDWAQSDQNLFKLQERIVNNASQRLTKNGLLCVSICSSDPSEVQHINQLLNSTPSFHAELSADNSEEITGWVIIKE